MTQRVLFSLFLPQQCAFLLDSSGREKMRREKDNLHRKIEIKHHYSIVQWSATPEVIFSKNRDYKVLEIKKQYHFILMI